MRHYRRVLVGLFCAMFATRAGAQAITQASQQPRTEDLQRANTLFTQGDWAGTLDAYAAIAKQFPTHALSRFRIGVALVGLGKFSDAEASLREGERLGIPVPQAGFRLAEALAEQHKSDAAIVELQRSASAGALIGPAAIENDAHFASLKSHPKWTAVLDAFDAVIQPCKHDPRFREFDFWVGDWDVRPTGVTSPAGTPARNNITLEDNGCVVMEHWAAPSGSAGQSFNLFDRSVGKWRQTWVDNVGGQHDYRGGLVNGNMVLFGDTPMPNGQLGRVPTRLTLFHVSRDTVRQVGETSPDSGRTWVTVYDLTYVRRK